MPALQETARLVTEHTCRLLAFIAYLIVSLFSEAKGVIYKHAGLCVFVAFKVRPLVSFFIFFVRVVMGTKEDQLMRDEWFGTQKNASASCLFCTL